MKEGFELKIKNTLFYSCIVVLMLAFTIPVNASSYVYSQQSRKASSKTMILSQQITKQLAQRRSYRSNRSYRPSAPRSNYRTPNTGRNFLGYAGAFGVGSLFGAMLNPFGGYYGGQHIGFSFFGLLLDILLILLIIWVFKKIFRRRDRHHY